MSIFLTFQYNRLSNSPELKGWGNSLAVRPWQSVVRGSEASWLVPPCRSGIPMTNHRSSSISSWGPASGRQGQACAKRRLSQDPSKADSTHHFVHPTGLPGVSRVAILLCWLPSSFLRRNWLDFSPEKVVNDSSSPWLLWVLDRGYELVINTSIFLAKVAYQISLH